MLTRDTRVGGIPGARPAGFGQLGTLAGIGLLVVALVVVWHRREPVGQALAITHALLAPRLAVLGLFLLGSTLASIGLSGLMFGILKRPYGRVGFLEMQAVIAAATLVNLLPARVGWVGRVAYHRAANGIAIVDSVKTVVQALAITAVLAAYGTASVVATLRLGVDIRWLLLAPLPLMVAAGLSERPGAIWLLAALPRYLEIMLAGLRYYVVFVSIGVQITAPGAVALSCVNMVAALVPVLGGGLGLRASAVALLAPTLAGVPFDGILTVELIGGAAETIVVLIVGSVAVRALVRRSPLTRLDRGRRPEEPASRRAPEM